jgi:hypothetical protein
MSDSDRRDSDDKYYERMRDDQESGKKFDLLLPLRLIFCRAPWLLAPSIAGFPGLGAEVEVIPVRVKDREVSHPVGTVLRLDFHNSTVPFYLVAVVIDLVAEDKSSAATDRPCVKGVCAQVKHSFTVPYSGILAEPNVLGEGQHISVVVERAAKIAHLQNRSRAVTFHGLPRFDAFSY